MGRKKTNEEFQEELRQLREQGHDVYCDDDYINVKTKLWFYCSKGHRWFTTPCSVLVGRGCPYCSGNKVVIGETSLWDTRPDVAALLLNPDDGYRYSAGSGKIVSFVCPICKTVHEKAIYTVCLRGLVCFACNDGVSYPEKFMYSMLTQLNASFKYQVSKSTPGFEWIEHGYRYDFYIENGNEKYFVEMDGKQHKYDDVRIKDEEKDTMADMHSITMIRINCDYPQTYTRCEYIKDNILCSQLNSTFNLLNIDWELCDMFAQTKMVAKAANLYNAGMSIAKIQAELGYHRATIRGWLKQATKLGLCNYTATESKSRGSRVNPVLNVAINQYSIDGMYIKTYASMTSASIQTGIPRTSLARACDSNTHLVNEYKLYRASDPNQPDKTKIILTIQN